jgi:hypothetical protein
MSNLNKILLGVIFLISFGGNSYLIFTIFDKESLAFSEQINIAIFALANLTFTLGLSKHIVADKTSKLD